MERSSRMAWMVVAACGMLSACPVVAQDQRRTSQFLPAGRDLRQQLSSVSEAVAEERFAEAAGILGEFFLDNEMEDYFLSAAQGSLKSEAEKLLLGLPRAGQESYELQFGADARMLLAAAVESGDDTQLADVMRQYFHTKAGYEAALIWSRRQLDAGSPMAAAIMLDRVLQSSPYLRDLDPELSLLAAVSWRLAGDGDRAKAALLALRDRNKGGVIEAGGERLTLFIDDSQALAWLDEWMGAPAVPQRQHVAEWTMHRGNAARNATTAGSAPVGTLRWHKFLGRDEQADEILARAAKRYQSENIAAIPTMSPLVVQNTVLMRTPERLMAIDLDTGKFIWRFPWREPSFEATATNNRAPTAALQQERELVQRVWEDRTYGQVASDGEAVYLIDELGYTGMGSMPSTIIRPGGIRRANPGQPNAYNKLVALSLAGQGKHRWTIGGQTGEGEPKLAGAFFLGVPLVHEERLYAMAEQLGELRLCVLDPASGKMLWSQQLGNIENEAQRIALDSNRRLAGATPSVANGILVCPTAASSVVGIDIAQRKLLWGYQYDLPGGALRTYNYGVVQTTRAVGTHWLDNSATIAGGKVILTPTDSDFLICLDLVTGKEAWKPLRRADHLADMLYVACVHEGNIILVGKSRITAIGLADGKPAWDAPIDLVGETVSGRGFSTDRYYFVATTQSQLLKINLATGKVDARVPTGRVLGNLVAYRDQIVSQQHDGVSTFYQSEALRTQLVERLKANPQDPAALAQRAQLELFDGQTTEALATLRQSHKLDPANDDTRALLVGTMLEALKSDFAAHRDLAEEVEPLLDQPQHFREFLRLKGQGLERAGDVEEAFATYVRLALHEIAERPDSSILPAMEMYEPRVRVRFDRWVESRLRDIYLSSPADTRAALDKSLATSFAGLQKPTAEQHARIVRLFGWHALADDARLALAAIKFDANDLIGVEALLGKFEGAASGVAAGRAMALLAQVYEKAGRLDYAADRYRLLRDSFGDVVVRGDDITGKGAYEAAVQSPVLGPRLAAGSWPAGKIEVTEGGDVVAAGIAFSNTTQRVYPLTIASARGALDDGSSMFFEVQRQRILALRDPQGREWNQVSLLSRDARVQPTYQTVTPHAHLYGHIAIVSMGQDLFAYDLLERGQDSMEALLWRQDLLSSAEGSRLIRSQAVTFPWAPPRNIAIYQADAMVGSVVACGERGLCFTRGRDVLCVDPLTGETLWERQLPEAGSELFGDDDFLFIVPPRSATATVVSVADGRELGEREVERMDNRWGTSGRHVLAGKQVGREVEMRIFDAWTGEESWSEKFVFGTRGTLVGRDEAALMEPTGKFTLVSIREGKALIETQLEQETKLMNIHVLRSASQYFVQMDTIPDAKEALANTRVEPVATTDPIRTGRLYAFDRATHRQSWQSPAYISQFGLPLEQPAELPLLVFLRQLSPSGTADLGVSREPRTSVLVLDRRDGRIVMERDNIRISTANYWEFVADAVEPIIRLNIMTGRGAGASKTYNFRFTDDPQPPSPPVQTGAKSSLAATERESVLPDPTPPLRVPADPFGELDPGEQPAIGPPLPRLIGPPPLPPGFPPGVPR